ncbi:hypothetical protein NK718_19525 [Alsobacter sp. SYSU M60028]|uniref:Uncharacterized protein n=1 Tax=Alsobacter ponti TaxID=2962936 RepID=A0ABT1LGU3_9HYPH|nr:hypothetical protein [Alsobacter ponti]MCP8940722.1 hypothetical protein [Alsobacter ponti]
MDNRIRAAVAELKAALAEAGIEGFGIRLFNVDDGEMLRYVMGDLPVFAIPSTAEPPAAFGTSIAEVGVMWVNERAGSKRLGRKGKGGEGEGGKDGAPRSGAKR